MVISGFAVPKLVPTMINSGGLVVYTTSTDVITGVDPELNIEVDKPESIIDAGVAA
jgi:hypothetical protein